ncbi:uncharacterized protein LOC105192611 isoform X3 [Harpegnathos saltator]|uniref:Transmembrane protein C20orf108 n=1 Tax=Harpegnathos saltator TaxID=610380 RepID=E2B9L0_HARSA|nr:uncharacterized protein LOC105192611 isoform X3 [Harpegnathos saltator]EFN87643.1 Transmembrane protein C20orf108 [Harpegnathos saltator]
MALSRINAADMMNALTRISRAAVSLEIQHATPAAIHQQQQRVEKLHMTSVRRYPEPPRLDLPTNMRDIFANETGRFTSERARDIALYSENGGLAITNANRTGYPKICDNGQVDSYDCFGAVSLCGTMQTNVPKPYRSQGTHAWVLRSTHLNMPGGQWTRSNKYIAEDMQRSHYRNLRPESCSGSAINTLITSSLLRMTYWPMQYTIRMNYSTDASEAPKDGVKDQATAAPSATLAMSKRDRFRLMLRDYGGTMMAFHITISLMSLGACYMVVVSGVDVTPLVEKLTGGNEEVDSVIKTSTDFVIAYTVHKLFAPVRLSVTLAATPLLVKYLRRIGLLKKSKRPASS